MSQMVWPAVYPFRLKMDRKCQIVPEFPDECEWQCLHSDDTVRRLGYVEYANYMERRARTRDERQCRGCGRWGIFEPRMLPPSMWDQKATFKTGQGRMWFAPLGTSPDDLDAWTYLGETGDN